MANLLIPAAGDGSRFVAFGIVTPKPAVLISGKPIIYWSILGGIQSIGPSRILIAARDEHNPQIKETILNVANELNTPSPEILYLNYKTSGPAETIYQMIVDANNRGNPIVGEIYCLDSDSYISYNPKNILWDRAQECYVISAKSVHPDHSYIISKDNSVIMIKEKDRISNNAVAGCYIFKSPETYIKLYEEAIVRIKPGREIYLSDIVKISVENESCYEIPSVAHIPMGTIKELEASKKSLDRVYKSFRSLQGNSGATVIERFSKNVQESIIAKSYLNYNTTRIKDQVSVLKNTSFLKFPKVYHFYFSNNYSMYEMQKIDNSLKLSDLFCNNFIYISKKIIKQLFSNLELAHSATDNPKPQDELRKLIVESFMDKSHRTTSFFIENNMGDALNKNFKINDTFAMSYYQILDFLLLNIGECSKGIQTKFSHGDLSLSNILFNKKTGITFIDPNPDLKYSMLSVDMGKILQTLVAKYEITNHITVTESDNDLVNLRFYNKALSSRRLELLSKVAINIIEKRYGHNEVTYARIFLIFHYLRLLSYIAKNDGSNFLKYFYMFLYIGTKEIAKIKSESPYGIIKHG